ncbi:hypothetical protein [Lentzea sp. NEAU-D7]|nr:hypothetical protein [Lentzea sp. NEAU-D7]MCX2952726.1 hypothetical protein [Lentzea sp. NEAU-D7]
MTISSRWAALVRQVDVRTVLTVAGLVSLGALAAVAAAAATSIILAVVPE